MSSSGDDRLDGLRRGLREYREARAALARYEVQEKLGDGGMAVVLRAWDRELKRPVALKILRGIPGRDEELAVRLEREARVTATLSHPNVVALYDLVRSNEGLCLVMELVEGPPLSRLIGDRKRDLRELVSILEKAARGVAEAHARGIVHGDLRPANILIGPTGEPKVRDFGLAPAGVVGTPLYRSPEQARGDGATTRSDVYALGATLHEILAGAPRDLETVALKALERDPARRYAHAGEFADDLRRWLDGEPVQARPPGVFRRIGRWMRRR